MRWTTFARFDLGILAVLFVDKGFKGDSKRCEVEGGLRIESFGWWL